MKACRYEGIKYRDKLIVAKSSIEAERIVYARFEKK